MSGELPNDWILLFRYLSSGLSRMRLCQQKVLHGDLDLIPEDLTLVTSGGISITPQSKVSELTEKALWFSRELVDQTIHLQELLNERFPEQQEPLQVAHTRTE